MRAAQIAKLKTVNVKETESRSKFDEMLLKPGLLFLKDVFTKNGHDIRIAGGAVRDLIHKKGRTPDDIDLATTAVPESMIEMLK